MKNRAKPHAVAHTEQQHRNYYREFDFIRVYNPEADIHEVDGKMSSALQEFQSYPL